MFELIKDSAKIPGAATSKGRLKMQRANLRTTRPEIKLEDKVPIEDEFEDHSPTSIPNVQVIWDSHRASKVLCCDALGDAITGTFCMDITGAFPVTSLENMQAYFVVYDYDTNTIFTKPCPDFKDATITTAFKEVFNKLKGKSYAPRFNVTDNQATALIKAFLKT